eukprot:CAMPEP_0172311088 /NCGR_PEP_ID=MMETSP1058-20130122/13669_1 /TAXON_ID=83371 /ORGANISM="Detonula confervacea, Strain CCMP 353" /LENGTH=544 /DNA_ID=CAMNT_0013024149 /DNA_START=77 /DNA_END=1708 /DNA_ORIENTATION=+
MIAYTPKAIVAITATIILLQINAVSCFSSRSQSLRHVSISQQTALCWRQRSTHTQLHALSEDEERELKLVQEESRMKVLTDRRKTIRGILKAAEGTKNYRLANDYVPELDPETGKPIKSDAQSALTLTAFVVAGGAVLLRVGGRAALVSALGLDFATENPQLKDGLDQVLNYASTIGTEAELALFVLAWTAVKVLCIDAGGVVLALASGILFGGVWQGAVVSAFAATVGSSVAFGMAKLDTPVREKALEVVEEYPSLRGIEKVVAKDGMKAILTLRLAPVLPIPIGMYNYVYGVTNVPYLQFAGGVFLGSLKPYLLDSYLGVFGKQIVDGTAQDGGGTQDALLLIALGVSVLIGVFASQLASETWEAINEEVEIEKAEKAALEVADEKDGVMREFMGMNLPQFLVGFQLGLQAGDKRVNAMIEEEYHAGVWNYTMEELETSNDVTNPATQPGSSEVVGVNSGFDFGASICDGLVLSPALLGAYLKYADPLYVEEENKAASANTERKPMEINAMDESNLVGVPSNSESKMYMGTSAANDVSIDDL